MITKLFASHVNLGEVCLDTNLVISLDVLSDGIIVFIAELDINVALETDTIDSTVSILQVFDKVENLVRFIFVNTCH